MRVARDRGAVSVFVALSAAGMVLVALAVLDACGRLRAVEANDALVQEAARAAGQQLDQNAVLNGDYRIETGSSIARQAAADYLHALDPGEAPGIAVAFADGNRTITITVTKTYHSPLLGAKFQVKSIGSATLVHGITKPENG